MRLAAARYDRLKTTGRKLPFVTALLLVSLLSLHFLTTEKTPAEKIKDHYIKNLGVQQQKLKELLASLQAGRSQKEIQQQFLQCRIAFKKTAFLTELFNPFESRLLNGPALKRTEEDNPQTIIEPRGFQVLEEVLFGDWKKQTREKAAVYVKDLRQTIRRLQEEPDLSYQFRDEMIFNALRASLVRLSSMGISGFDSPIAGYSMPEAVATLDGIRHCVSQYNTWTAKKNKGLYLAFNRQVFSAKNYIRGFPSFEKFDRLVFLKKHLNPLFASITAIRDELGILLSNEWMPVNQRSTNLFDASFFNADFFSPNESYRMTPERVQLGKLLFFDPILSGTRNRSCGSCHQPQLAFTDGVPTPFAIDEKTPLTRNTPTLWNSVFQTRQFFDSRTTTLENQLSDVVHNREEMSGSLQENIPQLKNDPTYAALFKAAYKNEKEPVTQYHIANAIASYIRSLVALNSRFDQYMRGDETKMNVAEKNGFNLFMGKARCGTCHYLPLFNGLIPPDFHETESEVLGVPQTKDSIHPRLDPDEGKYRFTRSVLHRYSFKTPTLRNIALTAPYMHNGVFTTLEEVMQFYNKGGGKGLGISPVNQTLPFDKLNLSPAEIKDIIAFMRSLTDTSFAK